MLCIRAQYKIMTCILLPAPIPRPPHNPSQHISMRSPPPACLPALALALALALASLLSAPAGCACASVSFVSAMKRIPPPAIGPTAAAAFAGSSSPGHGLRARRATVRRPAQFWETPAIEPEAGLWLSGYIIAQTAQGLAVHPGGPSVSMLHM